MTYPEGQPLRVDKVGGPQQGVDRPGRAGRPVQGLEGPEGLGGGDAAGWQVGTATAIRES